MNTDFGEDKNICIFNCCIYYDFENNKCSKDFCYKKLLDK